MPVAQYRPDCAQRWREIKKFMGDISGKSLVDIGCCNGFFCEQFLLDGGKSADGIDTDSGRRAEAGAIQHKGMRVLDSLEKAEDNYDFCLFLDLQYHDGIDYLQWCKEHAKISFISTSGDGELNNQRLRNDLIQIFKTVEQVAQTQYANRMIYKCE